MEFNDTYHRTQEKLYWLACSIQSEIETFQPDLLIVLARGGLAPLWAVKALWEETNTTSNPPVLITNLGREKLIRYEYQRAKIGMNHMPEIEPFDFYNDGERGYFLAWLDQQADWRKELRQQVEKVLGSRNPPARILIIDDTVFKRYTTLIALGLLLSEYPQAETRMMTGDLPDWRPDLAAPWVEERKTQQCNPEEREFRDCIYNLAPGISDIDRSSLQWEPLTASSLTMREYGKFLSVETWLELPVWLKWQVQTFVKQAVHQTQAGQPVNENAAKVLRPMLNPQELQYRQQWLTGSLPVKEAAGILGVKIEKVRELLKEFASRSDGNFHNK